VAPSLESLEFLSAGNIKLFRELLFTLLINLHESLGDERGAMGNSGNLCSQEVSFLAEEGRV
jgi:hypothetical protein